MKVSRRKHFFMLCLAIHVFWTSVLATAINPPTIAIGAATGVAFILAGELEVSPKGLTLFFLLLTINDLVMFWTTINFELSNSFADFLKIAIPFFLINHLLSIKLGGEGG